MVANKKATKKRVAKKKSVSEAGSITPALEADMKGAFEADAKLNMLANALTEVSVKSIAKRREVTSSTEHSFSIKLDKWGVTNQQASGRCWLFAGLNILRVGAMKKLKLNNFEFSQNWPLFWDKLEKANHFLEAMIKTATKDIDDRTVNFLIKDPIGDGGQWNMFVNIINKYGLVPKSAMPESHGSSHTGDMNGMLVAKLREGAKTLRAMKAQKKDAKALRAHKEEIMTVIYRILRMHLGTPPKKFDFQWRDKDNKFHREKNLTPKTFAAKYVTLPIKDYVCLVHDPRHETGRTYTVEHLGNVVGGERVTYLNIDINLMKKITLATLKAKEPVWFGCDVGKQMDGKAGIWDAELFDFESIYDTTFSMNKTERLLHNSTLMTHAMVFTGADVVGNSVRRWRVENSWGDKGGKKGFYAMNDSWFDEYMFEIAARKKYLPPKLQAALKKEPIVLPAWDPMGSLARNW